MKHPSILTFLCLTIIGCSNGQTKNDPARNNQKIEIYKPKTVDKLEYSYKTAHPNAQALMKDDFFWSPIEEAGPFGSDDGWEAAQGFRKWRYGNNSGDPLDYLKDLISSWQYPQFDWNEMNTSRIKDYITSGTELDEATIESRLKDFKEALKNSPDTSMILDDKKLREIVKSSATQMNGIYLLGQDNAIIGTGFAQFAIEGKIDADLKALT